MNEHTDTHLTDYALDELDAAERAKIEAMLRDDPPAAAEVEELRGLATSLRAANVRWDERSEAHAESTSLSLRDSIAAHLDAKQVVTSTTQSPWLQRHWKGLTVGAFGLSGALAASFLFVVSQMEFKSGFRGNSYLATARQNPGAPGGTDAAPLDGSLRYGPSPQSIRDTLGSAVDADEDYDAPAEQNRLLDYSAVNGSNATTPPLTTGPQNDPAKLFFKSHDDPVVTAPLVALPQQNFGATATLAAPAGAAGPIHINGGALTITGANSYTGTTTISAGTLVQTSPASSLSTTSNLAVGAIADPGPAAPTFAGGITGEGTIRGAAVVPSLKGLEDRNAAAATDFAAYSQLMTDGIQPETWRDGAVVADPAGNAVAPGTRAILATDQRGNEALRRVDALRRRLKEESRNSQGNAAMLELLRQHLSRAENELEELQVVRERIEAKQPDTEAYDAIVENPFLRPSESPLSTFAIDVDTASYSNCRRMLNMGQLPPAGAVRLEEFVNYFPYDYPQPTGDAPFSMTTEAARCPWNAEHVLVRIGLKGKEIHRKERPASNLVFLVDVSGSMSEPNKLPLVRESLKLLVRELGENDRVAMVVYAGNSGLVLAPTGGDRKAAILNAIEKLEAGGSTNGAAGIELAYQLATDNFIKGGVNRVVLATDGDFNVGVTSQDELVRLIEAKAESGVFFSALGYGMGNYKDSTLEKLADKGNGNYAYIDTLNEARKVLVEQMSGTLVTIAKDVKIQIEFNPARVAGYRLLGYENRILAAQDFNDDKKDAGEIGAGHSVTALYELIPTGKRGEKEAAGLPEVDPLKYQPMPEVKPLDAVAANELLTLKLRYKQPDGEKSKLLEQPLTDEMSDYAKASADFKFASAVAGFGMLLRDSKYKGSATFDAVVELAMEGVGRDEFGYRKEFVDLVRKAKELWKIR